MKGKLGRYLDLDEHLALGVTWYPGFTHHVTWAALWDFMTAFRSGGVKAWDAFVESPRSALPFARSTGRWRRQREAASPRGTLLFLR
jgi:2,3-dimethylmalate lyase